MHLFSVKPTYRLMGRRSASVRAGEALRVYGYGRAAGDAVAFREVEGPNGEIKRYYLNAGHNPPDGVAVTYYLKERPAEEVSLTFKDQNGDVIKRFSTSADPRVPAQAGTNRIVWDMRYPNARQLSPGAALSSMEWRSASGAPGRHGSKTQPSASRQDWRRLRRA